MVSLADLAGNHSLAVSFYPTLTPLGSEVELGSADAGSEVDVGRLRAHGWQEYEAELMELGFRVVGISAQSPEVQVRFDTHLLSDSDFLLADELGLPTRTTAKGERALEAADDTHSRGTHLASLRPDYMS
jgi:peroxiredoxin